MVHLFNPGFFQNCYNLGLNDSLLEGRDALYLRGCLPAALASIPQMPVAPAPRCCTKNTSRDCQVSFVEEQGVGEEIIQLRTTGLIHHFLLDASKNGLIKQMIGRRRKGGLWETYKGIGILTESLRIRWISVVEGWLACQNVGEEIPVKETTRTNESKVIYVKQFSVISGQGMYGKGTGCKVGGR